MVKIISIINLKGGVGKTVTAITMSHILATVHNKKVLLIDNDKQGNTSKFFNSKGSKHTIADIFSNKKITLAETIRQTEYPNLEIITADMTLLRANLDVMLDMSRQQQTILRDALLPVKSNYDFIIIDNAPDINISTINALVASDEVIIPVKVDKFAFDGFDIMLDSIEDARAFNQNLTLAGCLLTMIQSNTLVDSQGVNYLNQHGYPVFNTVIRRTKKVDEMTFYGKPLLECAPRCTANVDYLSFVKEYLEKQ